MNVHKTYLMETVPELVKGLHANQEPAFGLMTAHHMIEHLVYVAKSSVKDYGPPPAEFDKRQQSMMRFVERGAKFEHRPSDKTRADLDPPRTGSIEEAIALIPEAIARLYAHDQDRIFYNPFMGKLTFDQMELLQANHFKYHLEEQFGLSLSA